MAKNYDDLGGVWRTIGGRRVFIKDGQSLSDAMKESGKFNKKEKIKTEGYKHKIEADYEDRLAKYKEIQKDANKKYDKGEIDIKERNKLIDDAHDKYIKQKIKGPESKEVKEINKKVDEEFARKLDKEDIGKWVDNSKSNKDGSYSEIHQSQGSKGSPFKKGEWVRYDYDKNGKRESVESYPTLEEAKAGKINTINNKIKGNSMNDNLRRKAYQKYMKEHPNSKMKFEDFIK